MNRRQIRNAITTARQLAQFKEKLMTWGYLWYVTKVAEKFDNYLKGVYEEMSDDLITRGEGIRWLCSGTAMPFLWVCSLQIPWYIMRMII